MTDIKELSAKLAEAIANNDVAAIETLSAEVVKSKTERHKAEIEKERKEQEALAGKREALTKEILSSVKAGTVPANLDKRLAEVKAKGFTYTIDHNEDEKGRIDPNGSVKVTGGVGLLIPAIKARKANGGGGGGKTKDEFGMSLSEVFEKFATSEDRAKLAEAEAKDAEIKAKTGKSNSVNAYNVKQAVKKAAIAAGLLAPAK